MGCVHYLRNICAPDRKNPDSAEKAVHPFSGEGTINGLPDDLLEDKVIKQEEMSKVRDENDTVMDEARVLIDLVIGKGCPACQKVIQHLCEEDPELAHKLGLR